MRKSALALSIICFLVFTGCGRDEEAAQQTVEETEQAVQNIEEKAEETAEPEKETAGVESDKAAEEKVEDTSPSGLADVIEMKNKKAFAEHRMGIVWFEHQKHASEKPEGYGLECGECHHDKNGKPLTDLKPEDEVETCYSCHDKAERPSRDSSMSQEEFKEEQLKFYYGAIHENCIGCHKETAGPTVCTECHPKSQ